MNFSLRGGKLPLYVVILACLLTGIFTYAISSQIKKTEKATQQTTTSSIPFKQNRLKDYKFVRPIIFSETPPSPEKFGPLLNTVSELINKHKAIDQPSVISVYIRDMNAATWCSINEHERFDAGSIFKLPILIALLKKAEKDPAFLSRKTTFTNPTQKNYYQTITSATLKKGETYTVKELIKYMIVDSDNEANLLLYNFLDQETILKVFSDLEIIAPDPKQNTATMNCLEVSKFLRVLYNSGYTNPTLSEFSMQLLSESTFHEGMKKGVPKDAILVHKFGERGYPNSTFQELSETGIIYLNNERILLTVMTKGNNQQQQAQLISDITRSVCDWVRNSTTN